MKRFFDALFEWERPVTEGQRLFFRVMEIIVLSQILYNIWDWAFYIKELTDVVLPLSLANYIDVRLLFGNNLPVINAGLITVLLAAGFLRRGRFAYFAAILLYQLQYSARFSQGEISHGANLGGIVLLCLGVSFLFIKKDDHIIKTALGLIYFFIGLGYVSAAFSKLIGTGLHWSYGEHLNLWIAERGTDKLSQFGVFDVNILQAYLLQHTWAATITLTFGLLVEFFGFLFWFRRTRWVETVLLLSLHIGIVFTLRIAFSQYVYLLLFIGFPWELLLEKMVLRFPALKKI